MDPNTTTNQPQKSSTANWLLIGLVALLLLGGGAYFLSQRTGAPTDTAMEGMEAAPTQSEEAANPTSAETSTVSGTPTDDEAEESGDVKEFTVTGKNFAFAPTQMKVKQGDKVRVIFENTGGLHDFVLDEFDVATKQIQNGQTETVEFTADKKGTFEYYCSVGQHRQMGMVGNLIVE